MRKGAPCSCTAKRPARRLSLVAMRAQAAECGSGERGAVCVVHRLCIERKRFAILQAAVMRRGASCRSSVSGWQPELAWLCDHVCSCCVKCAVLSLQRLQLCISALLVLLRASCALTLPAYAHLNRVWRSGRCLL